MYNYRWCFIATTLVLVQIQVWSFTQNVFAQNADLSSFPGNTANSRFYNDTFKDNIVRPALSVRGFDSNTLAGGTNYGYGLKQILNKVYNNPDPLVVTVYNSILSDAGEQLLNPNIRINIEKNSRILQARAFVALVTYILEKNGNDIQTLNQQTDSDLPVSHDLALTRLKEAFTQSPYKDNLFVTQNEDDDLVKWVKTQDNIARAIDLYLALENAYYYYGGNDRNDYNDPYSSGLLTKAQKESFAVSSDRTDGHP